MDDIRLRRPALWSAGASEARPRFGSLGLEVPARQSAVAAALCRRTPKVLRVAYPPDSSVCQRRAGSGDPYVFNVLAAHVAQTCSTCSLCVALCKVQSVHLRREDEVAFAQPVYLVRPKRDLHSAPGQINVGMMALLLGQFANFVGESQRFEKVLEVELFLQMALVNDMPAVVQLALQVGQGLTCQRRHAAFAWHAFFFCQFAHNSFRLSPGHRQMQPAPVKVEPRPLL